MTVSEETSGWTVDTLLVHLTKLIADSDQRNAEVLRAHAHLDEVRHIDADKAVEKATVAMEKRLDAVNEFRAQLTDQTATFMPRGEAEQRMLRNTEKVDKVEKEALTREEYNARHDDLVNRVTQLASRIDRGAGRETADDSYRSSNASQHQYRQNLVMGWIVGASSIILVIATLIYYATR